MHDKNDQVWVINNRCDETRQRSWCNNRVQLSYPTHARANERLDRSSAFYHFTVFDFCNGMK